MQYRRMARKPKVKVEQQEGKEVPIIVLAHSIAALAKGYKALTKTDLKQETLVTLLHDHSKVAKRDIRIILNCLDDLESLFLEKKP